MKAIFVDGASIQNMKRAFGFDHTNHKGVYKFVTQTIGSPLDLVYPPVYTIPPNLEGLKEDLERAGFKVVVARSHNQADDRAIIDLIEGLRPPKVKEVILVSCDSDYVPALMEKWDQGLLIYVVGTLLRDNKPQRSFSIGRKLVPHLQKEFRFIELGLYAKKLFFNRVRV